MILKDSKSSGRMNCSRKLENKTNERKHIMKRSSRFFLTVVLLASFGLCFGVSAGMAQNLVASDDVKVLTDNDQVRVLDISHKAGTKEPMHSHPAYVAVWLAATKIKVTTPDGKVVERDVKAGQTIYSGPVTHAIENIGSGEWHVIMVELKK